MTLMCVCKKMFSHTHRYFFLMVLVPSDLVTKFLISEFLKCPKNYYRHSISEWLKEFLKPFLRYKIPFFHLF